MKKLSFIIYGVEINFNPSVGMDEYFFTEPISGHGFYPNNKQYTSVWGRPFKSNCHLIAKAYIDSSKSRVNTLKTYNKK